MNSCEFSKYVNGYYSWKCQHCKSGTLPQLKCQSRDSTEIYQFQKMKKLYEKIDNEDKIIKTLNKTWRTLYQ